MAGITSSCCLFNPSSSNATTNNASSTPKLYLSSSSFTPVFHAKVLGSPRRRIGCLSSAAVPLVVFARHGGGYRPRPRPKRTSSREERRAPSLDSDDEALDISRLTSSSVRLIDEQQNMVGIVSIDEALRMAGDAERDLVILSEDADPPVLKIMDYNKYKYEQQKRKRDQQKKSAATRMDMKELKMGRPNHRQPRPSAPSSTIDRHRPHLPSDLPLFLTKNPFPPLADAPLQRDPFTLDAR